MSETEHTPSKPRRPAFDVADDDEPVPVPAGGSDQPSEREGLPRTYQMRADAHYVDQLESRLAPPAVRVVPARLIDAAEPLPSTHLEALAQSIKVHGIVQPVLVRQQNGRFRLIAGRRRLAAAAVAGLTEIPCLLYDVDEGKAAALAMADNLRGSGSSERPQSSASDAVSPRDLLQELAADLRNIAASAALLNDSPTGHLQSRIAADLVQTQAFRTSWLVNATALVSGQSPIGRPKSIAAIFERVVTGFEPEARLSRMRLQATVGPNAASVTFDDQVGTIVITGMVLATLAWLQRVPEPRIELHVDAPHPPIFRIEVAQRMAPLPPGAARDLFELSARGSLTAALGGLALKAVAAQYGGMAELVPINESGSVICGTFSGALVV